MKKLTIAFIAGITLSAFGFNKPGKVERRKGIMNTNEKGRVVFTPLEDWQPFTPVNDTLYQYHIK